MEYLTRDELVRLFKVARDHNKLHHIAMLVGLLHGLRVSEMLAIRGCDICDGKLSVRRLKKSRATLHALRFDSDPLFDESPLLKLAQANPDATLFRWSRQYMDIVLKRYAALAGIHPSKAHYHVLKHSICVLLWQETHDLRFKIMSGIVAHRAHWFICGQTPHRRPRPLSPGCRLEVPCKKRSTNLIPVVIYFSNDSRVLPGQELTAELLEESDSGLYVVQQDRKQALFVPRTAVSAILLLADAP